MLTVHPTGAIHYTLDGSEPTARSPRYDRPVTVTPPATLKAVCLRPGLKPSRVATAVFTRGPARPRIAAAPPLLKARAGKAFSVRFAAEGPKDIHWLVAGKTGETYQTYEGHSYNPPRHFPWMEMDPNGLLHGTPRHAGVYPVIVSAWTMTGKDPARQPGQMAADARMVIVVVEPAAGK